MYRVAVIGDKESILGFSAIGFDIFAAYDHDEAKKIIHDLAEKEYGIIYVTEKLSLLIDDVVEEYRNRHIPTIITIPGNSGTLHIGAEKVKEYARKAVGIDIVFKEDEES